MTSSLADFVVDQANQAALAAARSVAESAGMVYGPLLLVGPSGVGKTHLLEGIEARARGLRPTTVVSRIGVSELSEMIRAPSGQTPLNALRDRLAGSALILLDDFELIGRFRELQAFWYDVLETAVGTNREVVLASNRALNRIDGLDPRLTRRIREGTMVEVGVPGREARRQLLRRRVEFVGADLTLAVSDAIAGLELGSVREYIGALSRVIAFQQASDAPLAPAEALLLIGVSDDDVATVATATAEELPPPQSEDDEFGAFLSDVVANVSQQLDQWRGQIIDAMADWQRTGIQTRRLEDALTADLTEDPGPLLAQFRRDVELLTQIAQEATSLAPDLVGSEVLRDPDQLGAARGLLDQARSRQIPLSAPLPDLKLGNFGEGTSNRLAVQAARAVVAEPGHRYNPLLIVGASGVGKTHLLHGIGNALIARGLGPVACVNAHSLTAEIAALGSADALATWRTRTQWVGAFLFDDFHLLAGQHRAQEELLLLFSALHEAGRPLVFTSARRLSDLDEVDPRLLTRLEAGLVVDLLSPDRDVRLHVVKTMLENNSAAGHVALTDYLASRNADSVRAVQGAVQRVLGEAAAHRTELTPAFAREVLDVVEAKPARVAKRAGNASGIISAGLGLIKSREKMITEWPDRADRLIPEVR